MNVSTRTRRLALGVVFIIAAACSCRSILRFRAVDRSPTAMTDEDVADQMNPYVLTDITAPRLVIEVNWVAGCHPSAYALDGLKRVVEEYQPKGRRVDVELGDEIPLTEWTPVGAEEESWLVERHLKHDPISADYELAYVLYAPRSRGYFGQQTTWLITRGKATATVDGLVIYMEAVRKRAFLWITAEKIEKSTLIHEFGHLMGLVRNGKHESVHLPGHCTETNCVMTHPELRVIFANALKGFFTGRLPWDYCRRCQDDIRRAQAVWRARAAADPSFGETLRARRQARVLQQRGRVAEITGRPDEAGALYRAAEAAVPEDPRFGTDVARRMIEDGRVDEALPRVRALLAKRHDITDEASLAKALCAGGRYNEAISVIDRSRPDRVNGAERVEAADALAWALEGAGRFREAADLFAGLRGEQAAPIYRVGAATLRAAALYRRIGDLKRAASGLAATPKDRSTEFGRALESARQALARGESGAARLELDHIADYEAGEARKAAGFAGVSYELRAAYARALAGQSSAARSGLAAAGDILRDSPLPDAVAPYITATRARALAAIGDIDQAVAVAATVTAAQRAVSRFDPCLDEDLARLRSAPRFVAAFPWCH